MLGIYHPFSGALYERDGHGNLLVTDGERWGRFRRDGSWIEGELRECDPQLAGWVVGPIIANHRVVESVPPPGAAR
jgi:hypothetical protein